MQFLSKSIENCGRHQKSAKLAKYGNPDMNVLIFLLFVAFLLHRIIIRVHFCPATYAIFEHGDYVKATVQYDIPAFASGSCVYCP